MLVVGVCAKVPRVRPGGGSFDLNLCNNPIIPQQARSDLVPGHMCSPPLMTPSRIHSGQLDRKERKERKHIMHD